MNATHRGDGAFGELVVRVADDGHQEVVSNGMFLMDTRDGRSERGLVTHALAAIGDAQDLHLLIGGLGVGFSLGAALASERVARVTVVEIEPAVVDLVRRATGPRTGADLDDPRVTVVVGDLAALLQHDGLPVVDVLCLDIDNGPGWTLGPGNDLLYGATGIERLLDRLRPDGVLSVWSAHDAPAFVELLARRAAGVETHSFEVARGEPDLVWVARRADA